VTKRASGGLVTALRSLVSHHDVTWIASAISDEDRAVAAERGGAAVEDALRDGSPYRLRLVVHDGDAYEQYYNVVANPLLWFVQHYLWDLAHAPDWDAALHAAWHDGYAAVNRTFADAVLEELERGPDAMVFLHDYHLYLAPRLIRDARPHTRLAQFVHIPWPQSDYWRVLPERLRVAVHDGLLANDVVGVHAERWRRNFVASCADIVGATSDGEYVVHRGRRTLVVARPVSVDTREFDELAGSEAVLEAERRLVAERPERLVVRVDRTDPSKNIVRGFRAFELYLEAHPDAHGRVRMLALLDPSRQEIPQYEEYLQAVLREAERVNGRYPGAVDLRVEDDFPTSVAAYKQFDVLLVNAAFDGLNLVAKEAPLVNERDGVVVLSENTGAHEELGEWALTVNPFDVLGQAEALHEALELAPEERRRRAEAIRAHVRSRDVGAWIEALLADFDRAAPGA
jgi:trehalose 6-phosphate synthase